MNGSASQFSALLTSSARKRRLSDAVLSAEMGARGTYLSRETLAAWRAGESLPSHESWRPIVSQLEHLLCIEPGSLLSALTTDVESMDMAEDFSPSLAVPSARSYAASQRHFTDLNGLLDWSNEGERRVIEDAITMSADFRSVRQRTMIMARQPAYNRATLHISTHLDPSEEPGEHQLGIHDIIGADIAEILTQETDDGISKTTKLLLPPGKPGDIHVVQFSQHADIGFPQAYTPGRVFSWPLLYYTCTVTFEGPVPEEVLWNVWIADENDDASEGTLSRPLTADGQTVTATIENPFNVVTRISWSLER